MPRKKNDLDICKNLMPHTKYTDDVPSKIIEVMSEDGKGVAHVCLALNISPDTFYRWLRLYPEMNEAYGLAKAKQEVFYLDTGHDAMLKKQDIDVNAYKWLTQNVLKWGHPEQAKVTFNIENQQINNLSGDELERAIIELAKKALSSDGSDKS